ncbi:MAG: helix-turn-helix domain-containing protein [Pseudomonadota bacterium]
MSSSAAERENGVLQVLGLKGLSEKAATFLKRHPGEARVAVTAALEAVAAQYGDQDEAPVGDLPAALRPFVVERPAGEDMLGVSEAAARLKVSRTTVYDWVERRLLLGWRGTKRGLMIPAEQILGPGKVVPDLASVIDIIGDPELAWVFLAQEQPFADTVARPIDRLAAGDTDEVLGMAASFGTAVT